MAGAAPFDDMRDRGLPTGNAPYGRMALDDDYDDGDIDADFVRDRFGGNRNSTSAIGGGRGSMGGSMERMSGGMGESNIMGNMTMMNRMGGRPMIGGGLMAGMGGGPMGLMGGNLDGLNRLASEIEHMNAMRGNLRGVAGADGNMRREMDFMERDRERDVRMQQRSGPRMEQWGGPKMERRDGPRMEQWGGPKIERGDGPRMEQWGGPKMERGDGPRIERGHGPINRHEISDERQYKPESTGTVVLVSNMNHEVINSAPVLCLFYCSSSACQKSVFASCVVNILA